MSKTLFICFFGIIVSFQSLSQLAGRKSFEFLNIPSNARLAALGGVNVSLADKDLSFLFSNPSLIGDTLTGFASAGYAFFVADIGQSTFTYSHKFNMIGTLSFGVQHINYGEINGYDASGLEIGTFKSGESVLVVSKGHQILNFRIGVNLKAAFSNIAGFRSSAMMMDIGGTFIHPDRDLKVGLVLKNFGVVLSEYSETSQTKVPFDVQAGVSFKPEHMPVRVSVTVYNLTGGVAYDNPVDNGDNVGTFNKLFQHVNIGAELLFHRNVHVLLGYNALKQHELKTRSTGGNGFSIGAALKIKAIDFVLSRNSYSIGNAAYTFTLAANIERMIFKKRTI